MPHKHHKFNLGKAVSSITKPLFHEVKHVVNTAVDTPKELVQGGMSLANEYALPLMIVAGVVAVYVLKK